jgi:hypothetical protein
MNYRLPLEKLFVWIWAEQGRGAAKFSFIFELELGGYSLIYYRILIHSSRKFGSMDLFK